MFHAGFMALFAHFTPFATLTNDYNEVLSGNSNRRMVSIQSIAFRGVRGLPP